MLKRKSMIPCWILLCPKTCDEDFNWILSSQCLYLCDTAEWESKCFWMTTCYCWNLVPFPKLESRESNHRMRWLRFCWPKQTHQDCRVRRFVRTLFGRSHCLMQCSRVPSISELMFRLTPHLTVRLQKLQNGSHVKTQTNFYSLLCGDTS